MAIIAHTFGYKNTWIAVKNADVYAVLSVFPGLSNICDISWKEGISEVESSFSKVFISGIYEGWTFLIGIGLYDPSQVECITDLLLRLGKISEEVCYFSSYRTVGTFGFAKMVQGKIVRMHCFSGEKGCIYKDMGEKTEAEKRLGLDLATNEDELFGEGYDDLDEDDILNLAEGLSLDPGSLFGMEEGQSLIADLPGCQDQPSS